MKNDNSKNSVLLVDDEDLPQGRIDKMEAHQKGLLHRAFSVLLFDRNGHILLQKRAEDKYHSGGLWTNTCCSHPAPDESVEDGAARRLKEEMGIEASLEKLFASRYYLELGDGMIENEYDHVFYGVSDEEPTANGQEVMDQRFLSRDDLEEELQTDPGYFTEWFKVIWQDFVEYEKGIEAKQVLGT